MAVALMVNVGIWTNVISTLTAVMITVNTAEIQRDHIVVYVELDLR